MNASLVRSKMNDPSWNLTKGRWNPSKDLLPNPSVSCCFFDSELAFDLSYWKQAETQLEEKMAESVHDKQSQKEELVTKIDSIDVSAQDYVAKHSNWSPFV
jgi:hypothetical protein